MAAKPRTQPEALRKAMLETLYYHLICCLVVWLALFAPLYCQYHGLMIHFGDPHHDTPSAGQAGTALRFHQMASAVTMAMGFFVAAAPYAMPLPMPAAIRRLLPAAIMFPLQANYPPPHQPPRFP